MIKVAEPNKWKLKHRVVWEAANGKIPKGHCIMFLDGNKQNTDISNLALISRKENQYLNRYDLRYEHPELTKTGLLIAKIKIAKKER